MTTVAKRYASPGQIVDRPGFLKVPPTVRDSRKLFVGGLPTDITEEEFRLFFGQFGTIIDSTVMIDRVTHRSRGFGFVTFDDESVSRRLLNQKDGTGKLDMKGKEVEIKKAQPKPSTRAIAHVSSPISVSHQYFDDHLPYGMPPQMHYYAMAPAPYYHPAMYDSSYQHSMMYSSYPYAFPGQSPVISSDGALQ